MVYFDLDDGTRVELPSKPSDLTFEQWVDLKRCLIRYDQAVKDQDDYSPEIALIDALQIVLPGVDFSNFPVASSDESVLSLHSLIGIAGKCIITDEVDEIRGQVLEFEGYTFDPAKYEQFGGSVLEYIEAAELQRLMPNEPFTSSETTNLFYSLSLKQAAIVMRNEPLKMDFQERDAQLNRDALVLAKMPASYAIAISRALVNFLQAWARAKV